jgi:metallo-beta-lactamase family protein
MSISIVFHGATRSVTGSCIHVQAGTTQLLVDCGVSQDNDSSTQSLSTPFRFDVSQIQAVILTHGHLDHTGNIPLLIRAGFKGKIYGHYATCEIARIIWEDSLHHTSIEQPGYDEIDVKAAIAQCVPIGYGIPMVLNDIEFTLKDAGHILGSSHILMEYKGKRVLFSGDIGTEKTPIIRDPFTGWDNNIDAVVIESTYGSRVHKNRTETIEEFEMIVKKVIAQRGVLLIPAFAIGRTQEILYHLNTLVEEKRIPAVPVFVDSPMASEVTGIYRRHRDCYDEEAFEKLMSGDKPLEFRGLTFVESAEQSIALRNLRPPLIIMAGSGMCNGGRILGHLENFITKPETVVMFVGWQSRESLGRSLVDGAKQVEINGKTLPVAAHIATLNGFSAHADRKGLLSWAQAIPGTNKQWFVNHGEEEQAISLAELLHCEFGEKTFAVERGVVYGIGGF